MRGDYPQFRKSYTSDELTEDFLLDKEEYQFVKQFRGDVNRQTVAVLLKTLKYLGYFPELLTEIAEDVKLYIAQQLGLLLDLTQQYPWLSGSRDTHFAMIREFTSYRFATKEDKQALEKWLEVDAKPNNYTEEGFIECAFERLKELKIELPSEKELRRIVNAALNNYFQVIYQQIFQQLTPAINEKLDNLLVIAEAETYSCFDKLKDDADRAGVKKLQAEISKLQILRATGVTPIIFQTIPWKVLQVLKRRAKNEKVGEIRQHSEKVRNSLLASFVFVRSSEVIDDIAQMALDLINKVDLQTDKQLNRELLADVKKVEGKVQILFRVAELVTKNPDGKIREVIFSEVKEDTFRDLVTEFQASGAQYKQIHQKLMKRKYSCHYRQILPLLLENITFRSDNRFQPVIEALAVIKQYLNSNHQYFPVDVPITGVVTKSWEKQVRQKVNGEEKINRKYYEICVLEKLSRALKCKEIWIEGAYTFRNPNLDLPSDWNNEEKRIIYYEKIHQPIEVKSFIDPIRQQMIMALTEFDRQIPKSSQVKIITPGKETKGLFSVTKLEVQNEPKNLVLLKQAVHQQLGMLNLLDVFDEADRLTNFTRFFTHSGTKEVRTREILRPLVLLSLFAEGTNLGVKRVAKAQKTYSYDELLYVRKTYFSLEALRNACAGVVNKILQLRNPQIWGEGSSCASDGKHFESWSQNLTAQWRSRYKGYGIMVYWHVETNAVCIYSQLKTFSGSEVAAMIEGLIRHDTEMRVEKNFVDSHGQSEVAFAFCRLLGQFRLMPRLKRIKYERLYLPETGMASKFPNLTKVLTRPIRWDLIEPQYDEMVKSGVALLQGNASAEALLRRFNSYNVMHPTYKALAELGKAEKTIFLCEYLPSFAVQREVHEGLNVIENWNSAADFIRYGRRGEMTTNSREHQEISLLSLHLLQNCLVLINTILVDQLVEQQQWMQRFNSDDLRALTPLFYNHINPYGTFELDLERPSFLKIA